MRTSRSRLLAFAVLCLSLSACLERTATEPEQLRPNDIVLGVSSVAAPLVGTTWSLRELTDISLGASLDSLRPLRFRSEGAGELSLSTSLGCNTMGASVDTVGTRLRMSDFHTTLIGCDATLASLESGYAAVLLEVAYFGVQGDTLWFYDAGLRTRARYRAVR